MSVSFRAPGPPRQVPGQLAVAKDEGAVDDRRSALAALADHMPRRSAHEVTSGGLEAGAAGYLLKPIDLQDTLDRVRKAIERSQSEDET